MKDKSQESARNEPEDAGIRLLDSAIAGAQRSLDLLMVDLNDPHVGHDSKRASAMGALGRTIAQLQAEKRKTHDADIVRLKKLNAEQEYESLLAAVLELPKAKRQAMAKALAK